MKKKANIWLKGSTVPIKAISVSAILLLLSGSAYLNSAELYPAAGTWTATGSLRKVRTCHTATLLPSGKVLAAGGYDLSQLLNSAELYDPVAGTWTTTGSLATERGEHTATLLPSGKVLVAAGRNFAAYLRSAEVYDEGIGFDSN